MQKKFGEVSLFCHEKIVKYQVSISYLSWVNIWVIPSLFPDGLAAFRQRSANKTKDGHIFQPVYETTLLFLHLRYYCEIIALRKEEWRKEALKGLQKQWWVGKNSLYSVWMHQTAFMECNVITNSMCRVQIKTFLHAVVLMCQALSKLNTKLPYNNVNFKWGVYVFANLLFCINTRNLRSQPHWHEE